VREWGLELIQRNWNMNLAFGKRGNFPHIGKRKPTMGFRMGGIGGREPRKRRSNPVEQSPGNGG